MLIFNPQLDAKWLLEHQLKQNRARRAHEAALTEVASNKRKLEDAGEGVPADPQVPQVEKNPAKRIKVEHSPGDTTLQAEETRERSTKDPQSPEQAKRVEGNIPKVDKTSMPIAAETTQKPREPDKTESTQKAGSQEKNSKEVEHISPVQAAAPPPPQESTEQNDQPDPTVSDGDMNFESMFGDANAGNDQNNDLNFDLDLNPDNLVVSNPFDSATHSASNLELLPGLDSYANASGDDFNMLNIPPSTTNDQTGSKALNNSFDLPEIQGDTNFNDLFADGDFGGDASLMDLDLEDGFF
jgi:hypothetical protein